MEKMNITKLLPAIVFVIFSGVVFVINPLNAWKVPHMDPGLLFGGAAGALIGMYLLINLRNNPIAFFILIAWTLGSVVCFAAGFNG
jgi:hypothetical protein